MSRVIRCETPTVTEAWATVLGLPVSFIAEEGPSLVFAARKRLAGAQVEPAVVVADIQRHQPVPPFWNHQIFWNDRRFLARVGHRYLSVHFLATEAAAYETYDASFLPALEPWLRVFQDIYGNDLVEHRVRHGIDRIGYGYVNRFTYPAEGFDLSRSFKLSVGVDIDGAAAGLSSLVVGFSVPESSGATTTTQVTIEPDRAGSDTIVVTTKVSTELGDLPGLLLDDAALIASEILRAKEIAKHAFFELTTEATRTRMGAHYAAS
jgi:uncharacterized protein (TIGR04255 family)